MDEEVAFEPGMDENLKCIKLIVETRLGYHRTRSHFVTVSHKVRVHETGF